MRKMLQTCVRKFAAILLAEVIAIGLMSTTAWAAAGESEPATEATEAAAAGESEPATETIEAAAAGESEPATEATEAAAAGESEPATETIEAAAAGESEPATETIEAAAAGDEATMEATEAGSAEILDSGMYTTTGDVINGLYYFPMGSDTLSEVHYRDSYFYEPSTTYNKSLATASLAFEIAAGEACDNNNYTTGYADAEDFLDRLGFVNFEANDSFKVKPTLYTIGACMAEKEITLEDGSKTTLIALAIRGAGYDAEWGSNVLLGESGEAEGFSIARYQVVEFFNDYLENHEIHKNPKIWIVGYSRASAVADLLANYLNCAILGDEYIDNVYYYAADDMAETRKLVSSLEIRHSDVFTYGFEVPAAAVKKSVTEENTTEASDNSNIWCHVDPADVVPMVAPETWEFYRYGNEVNMANVEDYEFTTQLYEVDHGAYNRWADALTANFEVQSLSITNLIKNVVTQKVRDNTNFPDTDPIIARVSKYSNSPIRVEGRTKTGAQNIGDILSAIMTNFAKKVGSREVYSKKLEKGLSALLSCYMSADSTGRQLIANTLCDAALDAVKDMPLTLINDVTNYIMPHFSFRSDGKDATVVKLTKDAKIIVTAAINELMSNNKTRKYFGNNAAAIENQDFIDTLVTSLVEFAFWDYEENNGELLGTAIYYAADIIGPHLLENLMGYARANDPTFGAMNLGMQVLNINDDTECATWGLDVQVYYTNGSDEILVAKIKDDEISYAGEEYVGKVSLSRHEDGSRTIYAYNPSKYGYYVDIRITVSTDKVIYLNYLNWANANSYKDTNEPWENVKIPMTCGDEITMKCYDVTESAAPEFEKYISLNARVTDASFKDISGITVNLINKEGEKISTDRVPVYSCNNYSVDFQTSGNYKFLDMSELVLDAEGKPQKDRYGNYLHTVLNTGSVGRFLPDINTTSVNACFRFMNMNEKFQVMATGQLIEGSSSEDLCIGLISVVNNTSGKRVGDYGIFLDAMPGDIITVSINYDEVPEGKAFLKWSVLGAEGEAINGLPALTDSANGEFTFAMPAADVFVQATFVDRAAADTVTFSGYLYDPVNGVTSDNNLKLLYSEDVDNPQAVKVYNIVNSTRQTWFLLKAPSYSLAQAGDVIFDHWCVTHTKTGHPWGEDCDYTTANATRFRQVVYKGENAYEQSGIYNPNGSTYEWIMINSVSGSMTLMPVYRTATYTYNVTLSDGSVVTGSAAMGETVTVNDSDVASGKVFSHWSGSACLVSDETDEEGRGYRKTNEASSMSFEEAESRTLTFTMPRGDVEIQAVDEDIKYNVTVVGGIINGASEYAAGSVVTFSATNVPSWKRVASWQGNVEVTEEAGAGSETSEAGLAGSGTSEAGLAGSGTSEAGLAGSGTSEGAGAGCGLGGSRYSFVMPAEDVTLQAVYEDIPTHKLTIIGGVASYETASGATAEIDGTGAGGGSAYLCEGTFAKLVPENRAGYSFIRWEIAAGEAEIEESDSFAIIEIGSGDVTVQAVFEESRAVARVELVTDELPKDNVACLLPGVATCSSEGVEGETPEFPIKWSRSSGGSVSETVLWGEKCSAEICGIKAADGYKFTEETVATVNGEPAGFVINSDGSLTVSYSFDMEKAVVSAFQSELYEISGLANGISFDALEMYLLGSRHYITMEVAAQGITRTVAGTCQWDIEELKSRKTGDANGTYDPGLTTVQTFVLKGVASWDDWETPWSEAGTTYNGEPLGQMPISVKITVLPAGSLEYPVIAADCDQPGNYNRDVIVKLEYPGTYKSGTIGMAYMVGEAEISEDPYSAATKWKIDEIAAYNGPITINGTENEAKNYILCVASMALTDVELEDGTVISAGTYTSGLTYYVYTIDKSQPELDLEVEEVSLEVDAPVAGHSLDFVANVLSATTNLIDQIEDGKIEIGYEVAGLASAGSGVDAAGLASAGSGVDAAGLASAGSGVDAAGLASAGSGVDAAGLASAGSGSGELTTVAWYDTVYKAVFKLSTEKFKGVYFSENTEILINGSKADVTLEADGSISVEYEFERTETEPPVEVFAVTLGLSDKLRGFAEFPEVVPEESGTVEVDAEALESGVEGAGAEALESGDEGAGAEALESGVEGAGAEALESGDEGAGAEALESGDEGAGAEALESGDEGAGVGTAENTVAVDNLAEAGAGVCSAVTLESNGPLGVDWERFEYRWLNTDGSVAVGNALPNRTYKLEVTMYPEGGYAFAPTAHITVDGIQMEVVLDGEVVVAVAEIRTDYGKVEFVDSIISAEKSVANGVALSEIEKLLPGSTKVVVSGKEMQVDVTWDIDSAIYDAASKTAQLVRVMGQLAFDGEKNMSPEDIRYAEGINANVEFQVTVQAAKTDPDPGEDPKPSPDPGDDPGTKENPASVKTGDRDFCWIWISLALMGICLLAVLCVRKKHHRS